jgi:ribosomal protein S8
MQLQRKKLLCFLQRFNLALHLKQKYVISDIFNDSDKILLYLFDMRVIKNYKINNTGNFVMEIAYDTTGQSIIHTIKFLQHGKYIHHIKLKGLQKIASKSSFLYGMVVTRQGLVSISTCIKNKIGGYLLFWIY